MSKIVIDARELRTTTGRYVERLLHYLQEIDNEHKYVVLLKPKDLEEWKPKNRKFAGMACYFKEFTFAEQIGLLKQIRDINADLVHFPMAQQPILYRGPVVTTMNDLTTVRFRNPTKNWLVFTIKRWVYIWVNKIVARKSKALLTYSEFVKEDVAKFAHVNSRKITVTYLAADKITDEPEPIEELAGKRFIMYLGRPFPHKNLDRLVDAFASLQKSHPDLILVLAGKKDLLYRRQAWRIKNAGIEGVHFTGFVSEGQLRWLYENAAAYVFPSLSEGFGLPGLEAMMHGCPVVSSNATSLPEVYKDGAIYFDPENVLDMVQKIEQVIMNEKLAKDLAAKGKKVANSYSWQRTAEQTLAIYKEVLGELS